MNQASTITNSQLKEGYKQTEIGVISEDWKCVELDQLNPFITSGSRGWADFYSEYGDPFVRITNMFRESISLDLQDLRYVNLPVGTSEGKRTQLHDGDLLISITADIGIISYVDERLQKPAYINQHIALVRFDKDKVNSQFISYFLSHESSQKWFRGGTDQGAKAGMSLITVRKIKVAIPPLAEQAAIACTLSDIDALIESLDRILTKKRQIKQGAMQELLRSKDGWIERRLGDIAHIQTGSRNNQDKVEDGEYPLFVRSATVERINMYSYDCEAILIPGEGGIGSIFHYINGRFDAHQRVYVIRQFAEETSGKYIYLYMSKNFGCHAMQNSVKATVDSLRLPTFQNFQIFVPTLEEQNEIANILSDMDAEIESISAKLTKTRQLKQGMMHELLTGRIRLVSSTRFGSEKIVTYGVNDD
jgi:type I restriction enzyme, S subunit